MAMIEQTIDALKITDDIYTPSSLSQSKDRDHTNHEDSHEPGITEVTAKEMKIELEQSKTNKYVCSQSNKKQIKDEEVQQKQDDNKQDQKAQGTYEEEENYQDKKQAKELVEDGDEEEKEDDDYEAQRQRNILRNQQLMIQLGLSPMNFSYHRSSIPPTISSYKSSRDKVLDDEEYIYSPSSSSAKGPSSARKRMRKPKETKFVRLIQTRSSKRIRGEAAPDYSHVDLEALENNGSHLNLNEMTEQQAQREHEQGQGGDYKDQNLGSFIPTSSLESYSKKQRWMGRKQTTSYQTESVISLCGVPLTLGSIATTIWDIGHLYKGKKHRLKYWSGKGSMFRHPYPIGYKAEKYVFRERYMMEIQEGPEGPLFIVESASGKRFEGTSPTLPWTKACLASHSKGTRISGPLFFGFSDPITQKLIEELDGYEDWDTVNAVVEEEKRLAEFASRHDNQESGDTTKTDSTNSEKAL